MRGLAAATTVAAGLVVFGCGPSDDRDRVDGARAAWSAFRTEVAAGDGDGGQARRNVCNALEGRLREALRARAGGGEAGLPDCPFLAKVPELNGSGALSDLAELRLRDGAGGPTARATFRVGEGAPQNVVLQEVNPGNWQIVALLGLPG